MPTTTTPNSTWRTDWTTPQLDRAARQITERRCIKCEGHHATADHRTGSIAPPEKNR